MIRTSQVLTATDLVAVATNLDKSICPRNAPSRIKFILEVCGITQRGTAMKLLLSSRPVSFLPRNLAFTHPYVAKVTLSNQMLTLE